MFPVLILGQIGNSAGIENINEYLSNLAPVFIASMLSLSCPAASSISLEGKIFGFWKFSGWDKNDFKC